MRLPHQYVESIGLVASTASELIAALGKSCTEDEAAEIKRLFDSGLPPVTSLNALAVMTGYNLGFVWSLVNRPWRYYRVFEIPKGRGTRQIEAPRVALKMIQKWLSIHFERKWIPHNAVHGFVRGRSHISAARIHLSAEWVISIDIENFFSSTPYSVVYNSLSLLGYRTRESLSVLTALCCYRGRLSQGAPSSPVISNITLYDIDEAVAEIAHENSAKFTRYADDIVLSGRGDLPPDIIPALHKVIEGTPWRLSPNKVQKAHTPQRLKVHGLLVHSDTVKLTKGYRNKIRAFRHLLEVDRVRKNDLARIVGHVRYASQIK